ncbi:hypothetical protein Tco_0819985 [Tanacetum coccineum]|uniref:Uncharacterized protein n=1 Tax=Tanacetum coccineum TaxID=301880 RepID=A0ABQ5ACG4_9ASTR
MSMLVQKSQDHEKARDHKMMIRDYAWLMISRSSRSHSCQVKDTSQSLKSIITTSIHKLKIKVKDYEPKTKVLQTSYLQLRCLEDPNMLFSRSSSDFLIDSWLEIIFVMFDDWFIACFLKLVDLASEFNFLGLINSLQVIAQKVPHLVEQKMSQAVIFIGGLSRGTSLVQHKCHEHSKYKGKLQAPSVTLLSDSLNLLKALTSITSS